MEQTVVDAVLADWRTAPINAKQMAAFAFLEALALLEGDPTAEHVTALKTAGVSRSGIEDIIYVCFCFNVLTRLADAFDFDLLTPDQVVDGSKNLLKFGYGTTSL